MRNPSRASAAALLLVLLAVGAAGAQQSGSGQQEPQPPPQPGTPATPAAPPVNPEEEKDLQEFQQVPRENAQRRIELGEAFLAKFPESRYRAFIYSQLTSAYLAEGDVDKMFVAGEKALEFNSQNVDVMSMIVYAVPRRVDPNALDAQQKLDKVDGYARRIIEILGTMAKPDNLTEEDFARAKSEKLSMAHSGLAMVNYHRQKFPEMITELEQATQLSANPDPTDFYLLGVAYQQTQRFADAAAAYGKCAEVPWAWQDRCKQNQQQAQKQADAQPKP